MPIKELDLQIRETFDAAFRSLDRQMREFDRSVEEAFRDFDRSAAEALRQAATPRRTPRYGVTPETNAKAREEEVPPPKAEPKPEPKDLWEHLETDDVSEPEPKPKPSPAPAKGYWLRAWWEGLFR